ncbi:MAG TPA: molybdopterin-dependent oxidoreductase [Actinomycetota bacterium]|nr:molybdopterin-dependent oxidoreductase [Actinomycetota bacterium]
MAGATIGLAVAALGVGVAHLVAGLTDPGASPVLAVGQVAIDASPEPVKAWAIRAFGESNKAVLLAGIGVVLAGAAAAFGAALTRRPSIATTALVGFAVVGVGAALVRRGAGPADAVPTLAGALAAWLALIALRGWIPVPEREGHPGPETASIDRRRVLIAGGGVAVTAALSGWLGGLLARRARADASRADVRIPVPGSPAVPTTGADLAMPGLEPFHTPNDAFYRVDTALVIPAIEAEQWRLRIHGMVERALSLDYETLLARPLVERDITLACVSNPVGGQYVGNARWLGAPLRPLLEEVGVVPGADQVVTRSQDGFTIGTPTEVVIDGRDAMLAVAMNGEALPLEHGFPVRMLVPGLYGYVSAMKWIVEMELTTFGAYDAYWVQRGWAERAPVKTMSRIDTPRANAGLAPGPVTVAGVAWAQHRGIGRVEVRIDDGPWVEAELAAEPTIDAWRQWRHSWTASRGEHTLRVRATDGEGVVQASEPAEPFPDGATGYHTVVVSVR